MLEYCPATCLFCFRASPARDRRRTSRQLTSATLPDTIHVKLTFSPHNLVILLRRPFVFMCAIINCTCF